MLKKGKRRIKNYDAAIVIVRNPYDAIISDYNRHVTHTVTNLTLTQQYNSSGRMCGFFCEIIENYVKSPKEARSFKNVTKNVDFLKFEFLKIKIPCKR